MRMLLNLPLLAAVICDLQSSVHTRAVPDTSIVQTRDGCHGTNCPGESRHVHRRYDQEGETSTQLTLLAAVDWNFIVPRSPVEPVRPPKEDPKPGSGEPVGNPSDPSSDPGDPDSSPTLAAGILIHRQETLMTLRYILAPILRQSHKILARHRVLTKLCRPIPRVSTVRANSSHRQSHMIAL